MELPLCLPVPVNLIPKAVAFPSLKIFSALPESIPSACFRTPAQQNTSQSTEIRTPALSFFILSLEVTTTPIVFIAVLSQLLLCALSFFNSYVIT